MLWDIILRKSFPEIFIYYLTIIVIIIIIETNQKKKPSSLPHHDGVEQMKNNISHSQSADTSGGRTDLEGGEQRFSLARNR